MELGTYVELHGRPAVRFVRVYEHPIDRVWSAVTDATELQHWFPSSVDIDLRAGGTVSFSGDPNLESSSGVVLACDPPRHLAFTWGEDELHFDLEPLGGSCRFTLTNVLAEQDTAARNGSGWSVCLRELDAQMEGQPTGGPHSDSNKALFWPLYDAYVAAGVPSGAEIPAAP
jgi:uncharacterized protein YndB with AHSA1/START domain